MQAWKNQDLIGTFLGIGGTHSPTPCGSGVSPQAAKAASNAGRTEGTTAQSRRESGVGQCGREGRMLAGADQVEHRDAAGLRAAATLEARALAHGLAATVLTPEGGDFNDDLAALGAAGAGRTARPRHDVK